jgi:hypothetical protein
VRTLLTLRALLLLVRALAVHANGRGRRVRAAEALTGPSPSAATGTPVLAASIGVMSANGVLLSAAGDTGAVVVLPSGDVGSGAGI